jgi:hypothetical protein
VSVVRTCWLIGSVRDLAAQILTIDAVAQPAITAASRYLYHGTASLSLLAQVAATMLTGGATGATAVLLENRKVRLRADNPFALTWPADGVLRDLLGFTVNLAASAQYIAPNVSKLLWSPARRESAMGAPLGVVGHEVHGINPSISPHDGTRTTVVHGSRTYNEFFWRMVATNRVQSTGIGGEYVAFWDTVLSQGSLFWLWRSLDENTADTSSITFGTSLGPYVAQDTDWPFGRSDGFAWTDRWHPVTLPVELQTEYS